MKDKSESKVDPKVEAEEQKDEELKDEALENVDGGPHFRNFHGVGSYTHATSSQSDGKHNTWIEVLSVDQSSHKTKS